MTGRVCKRRGFKRTSSVAAEVQAGAILDGTYMVDATIAIKVLNSGQKITLLLCCFVLNVLLKMCVNSFYP